MAARPRGCRRWFSALGGGSCQECLELLAGGVPPSFRIAELYRIFTGKDGIPN